MNQNIYDEELKSDNLSRINIKHKADIKKIYFEFLQDFRNYLVEYMKESATELSINEMAISDKPTKLFNGETGGMEMKIKNQGDNACYINTNEHGLGGYRLDPGESVKFWLNKETSIVTNGDGTTVGFIRT